MNEVEILKKLVSFDTTTRRPKDLEALFDYVSSLLPRSMKIKKGVSNGFGYLYASTVASKKPQILLQAHVDVVPAPKNLFKLKQTGDVIVGRGVFDMKYAVACYVVALQQILDAQPGRLPSVALMLTSDEEIGGTNGVGYLVQQGYKPEVCILPDGGGPSWEIMKTTKGVLILHIMARGKPHHGARPWEGDNPIPKLLHALLDLQKLFTKPSNQRSTCTISKLWAGEAENQAPDLAYATLDIRFTSQKAQVETLDKIKKILLSYNCEIADCVSAPFFEVDIEHIYLKQFEKVYAGIMGTAAKYVMISGSSDARFFGERNIPVIMLRPPGGNGHGDTEWISAKGIKTFTDLLTAYIVRVSKANTSYTRELG